MMVTLRLLLSDRTSMTIWLICSFKPLDEFGRVVGFVLDVSELLFPDTRQLTALQEFLVDGVDELDTW